MFLFSLNFGRNSQTSWRPPDHWTLSFCFQVVIVAFYFCIDHKNKRRKTPSMRLLSFGTSKCSIMWCRKCCHSKLLSKLPEWGFRLADASVVDSSRVLTLLRFPLARRRFRSLHPRCTWPSHVETLSPGSLSWIYRTFLKRCLDFWGRPLKQRSTKPPNHEYIAPSVAKHGNN